MNYTITEKKNSLIIHTIERLNFEPKDWRKDLKKDLTKTLKKLTCDKKYLIAKLITNEQEFFDVENILFYNIGVAPFNQFDTQGLRFYLDRKSCEQEFKYIHEYYFEDEIELNNPDKIVEWNDVIVDRVNTSKKPLDYWLALKKSNNIHVFEKDFCGEFGAYIEIGIPIGTKLHIVSNQKALLDGIISSFHTSLPAEESVIDYISIRTGESYQIISNLFNNNINSCLSQRNLVQCYRNGIKWNPEDDKCIDVRIKLNETSDEVYNMTGYLFKCK